MLGAVTRPLLQRHSSLCAAFEGNAPLIPSTQSGMITRTTGKYSVQPGQRHSVLHIYFHQRHSLPTNSRIASENDQGASRMTHQGGGLATKPDNWSPVPGTHTAGRENQFRHTLSSEPPGLCYGMFAPPSTQINMVVI